MLLVLFATLLFGATLFALRPAVVASGPLQLSGFDGHNVIAGFLIYIASAVLFGTTFAFPLLLSLLLHEFGHVLAHRMLGHRKVRFRLIPLLSRDRISDQPLETDGEYFFVALMGPAFSLGPIALAMALSAALDGPMPELARMFWVFALTSGAVNFASLLPFGPLNGGKCARAAVASFWPTLAPALSVFMSTAMATASFRAGSIALFVLALAGAATLFQRRMTNRRPMPADTGLIALGAYTFTMAAHFSAGWLLFQALF